MKNLTESEVRSNKYWQDKSWNKAKGGANDMPNCTDFCVCAFHWCYDASSLVKMFTDRNPGGFPNAYLWKSKWNFETGTVPKPAAIAVWGQAKVNGNCGHVAFVKSFSGNNITVYQSNYGGNYFEEKTYTVSVGAVTKGVGAKFLGFCYHPYYKEEEIKEVIEESNTSFYSVGKNYTLQAALNVRTGAGTTYAKKKKSQLTKSAQAHATSAGVLKRGTVVTCQAVVVDSKGNTWLKIPSGYVCAVSGKTIYIK